MPFLQLSLDIGKRDPEPIEEALFAAGALSVTLQDSADDPILEPAPGATPLWPTVTVKALFANDASQDQLIAALSDELGTLPEHAFENIQDRTWEREWLKDFKPMRFGERLWVCPGGMLPPSDLLPVAGSRKPSVLISLDPGLAFGTGTHPTTALCLEWLDGAELAGKRIIDYGCGSGILAIAALKLGAASAVGLDIDDQALVASRENAKRNDVGDRLTLQPASAPLDSVDIVLANILAGPLHDLAPLLAGLVSARGHLVLSGILKGQAPDLARRYAAWFDMEPVVLRDDWGRLVGRRRSQSSGIADSG
jgi:ribosomal protein L11 methyltransferase